MRVTNKGARAFFIWTLLAFVVMLCVIGWSMAEAFNLSPYTFKLRSKTTAADSLYIKGDTLYADQMAVSLHSLMKAVAVQTDTVRGSSTIVGILSDTIRIDPDSSGSLVTITFGGYGGGLRWNQSTDAMQYTNDFSTWTDIGTGGSSTTNADSLDGVLAHMRPLTDGYVVKYDADGDSLYLSQDATGAAGDSNAIIYSTDRVDMYSDSALYFGEVTDSAMLWYNLTDDNIIAFVKIFYNEDVTDSALVTWGSMMAQIAATGSGDITGVITSDWLTGGASSGDVALGIDPDILAALYLTTDTTVLQGNTVKIRSDDYLTAIELESDTVTVQNLNAGAIIFNVFGTPSDINEFVVKENQVVFGTGVTIGGLTSKIEEAMLKAVNSAVDEDILTYESTTGDFEWHTPTELGLVTALPVWDSLHKHLDTLEALYSKIDTTTAVIPRSTLSDSANGGAIRAETSKTVVHAWIYNKIDTTAAIIPRSTLSDSANGGAIRAETSKTVVHAWIYNKIDTTNAKIPTASLSDSCVKYDTTNTLNWTEVRAEIKNGAEIFNKIDTTSAKIPTASLADSTSGGATRATTAKLLDSTQNQVVANLRTRATNQGLIQSNNFAATDPDSSLKIGSAQGLIIGSAITLGTDVTDDSLVQEFWPEYAGMTLFRGFSATDIAYNDSITIRGDADSANGNFLLFNDSTLTAGNHRRHVTIAIPVPDRVDSLRRVTVQVMSKDSSATIEFWMRGALFTRPPAYSLVDSAVGGSVLDRDSACATVVRTLHLAPGSGKWAVTPFTTRYLLLSARRDAGNDWNWGKAYKITAVWDRTKL